jgi:hypothetical protein
MTEFFRRRPELLDFQDDLVVVLYELDLHIAGNCLSLCELSSQNAVGIEIDRLVSSDDDEEARYAECRELAAEAVSESLTGLIYLSAAATWSTRNVVLFGDPTPARWTCAGHRRTGRPRVAPGDVRPLLT